MIDKLKPNDKRIITADAPSLGYVFTGWTGDIQYLQNPLSATTIVTMDNTDVNVTANYNYNDLFSGLVSLYKMDDNVSSTVTATIGTNGNAYNITRINSAPSGGTYSYSFNGTSSWGTISNPYPTIRNFTLAAWVKFTNTNTHTLGIIGDPTSGWTPDNDASPYLSGCNNGSYVIFYGGVATNYYTGYMSQTSITTNLNGWNRVLTSWRLNGTTYTSKTYINGNQAINTNSGTIYTGHTWKPTLPLGRFDLSGGNLYIEGNVSNVCFWDRAFSDAEAISDYNSGRIWT